MARGAPLTRGARRSQAPRGGTRNGGCERLRGAGRAVVVNGDRASVWEGGTVLETGRGDGRTTT